MVLPGHLAGGYLAARFLIYVFPTSILSGLSTPESIILLVISTISAELPDIDLIRFYFEQKKNGHARIKDHREYFTHAPSFWLIISILVFIIGNIIESKFIRSSSLMLLTGTWSHLLLDSLEHGVMWVWPLSKKKFRVFQTADVTINEKLGTFKYYWKFVTRFYFSYFTFYVEIFITFLAIWIFFK